jgi:DNA-binding transcriptional ArsR family regulator
MHIVPSCSMSVKQKTPSSREDLEAPDLSTIDTVTVLQALADPVRLEIVRQLAGCASTGALTCGQIEVPVGKSTASHHLKTLSRAGITTEREEGTRKYVSLRRAELDEHFPGLIDSVLRGRSAGA